MKNRINFVGVSGSGKTTFVNDLICNNDLYCFNDVLKQGLNQFLNDFRFYEKSFFYRTIYRIHKVHMQLPLRLRSTNFIKVTINLLMIPQYSYIEVAERVNELKNLLNDIECELGIAINHHVRNGLLLSIFNDYLINQSRLDGNILIDEPSIKAVQTIFASVADEYDISKYLIRFINILPSENNVFFINTDLSLISDRLFKRKGGLPPGSRFNFHKDLIVYLGKEQLVVNKLLKVCELSKINHTRVDSCNDKETIKSDIQIFINSLKNSSH